MRKTLLASAIPALMLAAGAASAQSASHDVELNVLVETSCVFTVAEDQINGQIDGFWDEDGHISFDSKGYGEGRINVACNTGVPYTVETSADANGLVNLTGQSTGVSLPARLFQGTDQSVVFGSLANGEELAGVGNGQVQEYPYNVVFNDDGSGESLPVPEVDNYSATPTFTLNFAL